MNTQTLKSTHLPVESTITWGVVRNSGKETRTVFCYVCKEVFGRDLTCPAETIDCKLDAEKSHVCRGVAA